MYMPITREENETFIQFSILHSPFSIFPFSISAPLCNQAATLGNTRPKGIGLKSRIARILKNSLQVKKRRVFVRKCSLTHIAASDDGRFRIERETKRIMMPAPLSVVVDLCAMNTTNPNAHRRRRQWLRHDQFVERRMVISRCRPPRSAL